MPLLTDRSARSSGVRDAAVMVETLDDLAERYRDELPDDGGFAGLRAAFVAEAAAAHDRIASDPGATKDADETLERLRARVSSWPIAPDDAATLASGYQRIHRRGRRALRGAERVTDTEHLHDLRKRVKDLWHAAEVVRPVAPKKMKRVARRAHELSSVIGEDHDLAVLADAAGERSGTLAPGEEKLLRELVDRRRAKLQRRALKRGRRLYHDKPKRAARPIRKSGAPV